MYTTRIKENLILYGLCFTYLVLYTTATFEACRKDSQCKKGYCCAGRNSFGFCMRNKQLGELCTDTYMVTQTFACGCEEGLTCAIVSRHGRHTRLRCVEIPPETKESFETTKKHNTTETISKLLTAYKLRNLLEVIKEKPTIDNIVKKHHKKQPEET